jgi:hypothetical protein
VKTSVNRLRRLVLCSATTCKWSIEPITSPNPTLVTDTRDNLKRPYVVGGIVPSGFSDTLTDNILRAPRSLSRCHLEDDSSILSSLLVQR